MTKSTGVEMEAEAKPAEALDTTCNKGPSESILRAISCDFTSSYVPNSAAHTRNVRVMFGPTPGRNKKGFLSG